MDKVNDFKQAGAEVVGDKVVLYRGANAPRSTIKKLRYNDYLSASKHGDDATGNAGASDYGKNIVRFELPLEDVEVVNGEFQYKGKSESLSTSNEYPLEIYKAYNDVYGSNYTAKEIDDQDNVRIVASQGLSDGSDEFDMLMKRHKSPSLMQQVNGGFS